MTTTNSFNMNLLNTASALEQVGQLLQKSHVDPPELCQVTQNYNGDVVYALKPPLWWMQALWINIQTLGMWAGWKKQRAISNQVLEQPKDKLYSLECFCDS